jgi:hypothetical protein
LPGCNDVSVIQEAAESAVHAVLAEVAAAPRFELHVPHGFVVARVVGELRENLFAPGALIDWRVTAGLLVPVIYSPDSSSGVTRAALPATTDNLENLRAGISAFAARSVDARVTLASWDVNPPTAAPPYRADGTPNGEPANWSVTARFDVG